jgi:hypothetical protein
MKTSQIILAAALGAGALWLFQRYVDRKLSGTGHGSQPPRNDAAGPRLPGMPPMPEMPAMPRSGAAPNEPRMQAGGSGWRELNRDVLQPMPERPAAPRPMVRETNGWFDRTPNIPERQTDAATVFKAWQSIQ